MWRVLIPTAATIVLVAVLHQWMTLGQGAIFIQPFPLGLILAVVAGFAVASGRLGVWREIFRDLRRGATENPARIPSLARLAAVRSAETAAQLGGVAAAILALIDTLASITEPPEVLGHLIAASLVCILYGLIIAHGVFAPIGARLAAIYDTALAEAAP